MITIVDYGVGNISAFLNIYKRLNFSCNIAKTSEDLKKANKLILPGVGSFDYAVSKLEQSGMRDQLDELVIERKIPVLGVCVGMQMLMYSSDEGKLRGLGWIPGSVHKFGIEDNYQYPLPHMGWNEVRKKIDAQLFDGLSENASFYFLHSYYVKCDDEKDVMATAWYQDEYACVINRENIYGIQCHPEKSHQNGITFLRNFGSL